MKKYLLGLLCIILCIGVQAQEHIELNKISDIRAQEDGTYIFYTGEAITTFYGSGGILIQDESGSIYLKSYDLSKICADPADAGYPNLKITSIYGVFHKASENTDMTQIEIKSDVDAYAIKVLEKNVDFKITDVALKDLMTNPMEYECQPIRLTQVTATITDYLKYFELDGERLMISTGLIGEAMDVPVEGTFVGYYGNNGNQGFIIPDSKYITPTAYQSIYDIKNSGKTRIELGILDPVLVNRVVKNTDGSTTLYIQEDYSYWGTYGTTVIVENLNIDIQEGDSIIGIRGYVTPFKVEDTTNDVYGSKIEQKGDLGNNIRIINRNNTLNVQAIQELDYIKGENAKNYESTLCSSPTGTIIKHGDKYFLRVKHTNTNEIDSVYIDGADFSSLVGEQHAVVGIVDVGIVTPGQITFVLRSLNDLLKDKYQFNNIADLRAAGKPLASGTIYELVNPVLVTYKREYFIDDVELIGVHVQDATGGLYIKKQINDKEKFEINAGDSVTNFKGLYVTTGSAVMLDFSDINNLEEDTYKVISSNNKIDANPEEVTIAELASNQSKYSSKVIKLTNVLHGDTTYTPWWSSGYPVTEYYLYQEGCSKLMFYSWNYPLYDKNNIIGIFDEGCDNGGFTILPLSAAHITDAENSGSSNVEQTFTQNISVLYDNGTILLSEVVDAIEIYNANGALIMKDNINSTLVPISLNKGIYIIRLHNNNKTTTCKIVIK